VELCGAHGYFTPAFYAKAAAHMERIHVRRRLKAVFAQFFKVLRGVSPSSGNDGKAVRKVDI